MKTNVKIALSTLLLVAIAVPVFAYVYSQTQTPKQIEAGIVVRYPIQGEFGVYWDYECNNPVTFIDFGNVAAIRYRSIYKRIYIRNEQEGEEIYIFWNSTLSDITDEMYDGWFSNGTRLYDGQVVWSEYRLYIPQNTAVGTYNWTLTIWAEY